MKPHKGQISGWHKITCNTNPWPGEKEVNLGYYIFGRPSGHPQFESRIYTSPVVKHEGNEIETLNSRYTLVGEPGMTVEKISKSQQS